MRKLIEDICRGLIVQAIGAKVTALDKTSATCTVKPLNGGAEILDVILRADDGNTKGQVIYPAVDSLVLVAPIDNDRAHYYVAMFSEVDEVSCLIGDTRFITGKKGVTIAKGNDGLKEVLIGLVDEVLKIYAPMNKPGLILIKNRIKQLLNDA